MKCISPIATYISPILDKKELAYRIQDLVNEFSQDENHETVVSIKTGKKRLQVFNEPFVMVTQRMAFSMAVNGNKSTALVFLYFVGIQAYKNLVGVDQQTIAEDLGYSKRTITQSIKELEEANIITSIPNTNDRRRNDYVMNPHAVWKGDAFEKQQVLRKIDAIFPQDQLSLFTRDSEQK